MNRRNQRHAKNEALLQGLNETIGRFHTEYGKRRLEFGCECGSPDCTAKLRLTQEEYEIARTGHTGFLVAPGHEDPTVDNVVQQAAHFLIVESKTLALREQGEPRG
jgi:hypothetical protein